MSGTSSAGEFCPAAAGRTFLETTAIPFENNDAILFTHDYTPRFGRTSNITAVLDENESLQNYLIGIVSSSIVIFIFFCLWIMTLLIFKCCGPRNVGFFSGASIKIPREAPGKKEEGQEVMYQEPGTPGETPNDLQLKIESEQRAAGRPRRPDEESTAVAANPRTTTGVVTGAGSSVNDSFFTEGNEDYQRWLRVANARRRRIRRIRITVLICGLVIVTMCVLMIVFGVNNLSDAVGSAREGLNHAENLTTTALQIIDAFTAASNQTATAAATLDTQEVSCGPLLETICQELSQYVGGNQIDPEQCVPQDAQVASFVQDATDAVFSQIQGTQQDLQDTAQLINDLNATIGQFQWAFWVAAAVATLLGLLTICIMTGVIMAWSKSTRGNCCEKFMSCIRGWCIVPLFALMVILGWIFSMVFITGSIATADLCYNSPDQNVLVILDKMKGDFNSILFQLIVFYVTGCPSSETLQKLLNTLQEAVTIIAQANTVASTILTQIPDIALTCGQDTSITIRGAAEVMQNQLCAFTIAVYNFADFLTCANWQNLYALIAYESICTEATRGFSWIATTQFIIVFFSLIMLTLRVAFYETEDEEMFETRQEDDMVYAENQVPADEHAVDAPGTTPEPNQWQTIDQNKNNGNTGNAGAAVVY